MTSIILTVTGAKAQASVSGPLTAGMVGIPVTVEYDEAWEGLRKNLVCRCGQWGPEKGETRTILNVEESATVAHEVLQSDMYLYLAIEGYTDDGKLVVPTTWASCGKIQHGANVGADPSVNPRLAVWNQLQTEIKQIRQESVTQDQVEDIHAWAQMASQAAFDAEQARERAVDASNIAISNANTAKAAAVKAENDRAAAAASAQTAVNMANGALQAQRAAEAAAERAEAAAEQAGNGADSGQNVTLTTAQISALDGMFKVCAFIKEDVSAEYAAFCTAFGIEGGDLPDVPDEPEEPVDPEVTLTGISAAYSGGDVTVGTDVADLTGIVVTAHYSDNTSKTVTGYTLSGEIAEGENIITVTYQGKTATFTVNGIAETTGDNNGWTNGVAYNIEWTDGYIPDNSTGELTENASFSVSPLLPCAGASAILADANVTGRAGFYWAYDGDGNFLGRTLFVGNYPNAIPSQVKYLKIIKGVSATTGISPTPVKYEELLESTVWSDAKSSLPVPFSSLPTMVVIALI